ncbi:cytochrome p450 oxidoreductase [Cordyceps javanica]|uniref:Cytochrome p450 oxidoreductase n=1 Tax=Cordyceps javanica TaxID=43265 RepID=A0A545UNR5_9HYPO|nr:cytochrome p450 oxidoreductase [Cordyceps javanica]TQW02852.1 cytochrome p450 oxidoreductase [Cordyceps javanica]
MYFLFACCLVALGLLFRLRSRSGAAARLPPGPVPLPIIGSLMDLPPEGEAEFKHWLKFKDRYGPISSITVLGQTMIILHDKQAALDVLEKAASKSSSRPRYTFATMCGFDHLMPFKHYEADWRQHRKMVHQQLGTKKLAEQFNEVQDVESRRFILNVARDPQALIQHIKNEAAAIILKITYGYATHRHLPDPLVHLIEEMMNNFSKAQKPGYWMVDLMPALESLPAWLPGMGFKATAAAWRKTNTRVEDVPFSFVQGQMAKGVHRPSYVSKQIERNLQNGEATMDPEMENTIKRTAAVMYAGGADTTVIILSAFFLAMILYPDVQRKAQKEIDTVIGSDRLPGLQDRDQLPYVSAIVKEALRWFPVTPMGVPHSTDDDIPCGDYIIPKGSIILFSTWWFQNDPEVYANPAAFEPERFLAPRNEPDPAATVFGHGRRVCPGKDVADMSLFWTISRVLAVLDIRKAVDATGQPMEAKLQFTSGSLSHPAEFPFDIVTRSPAHAELVKEIEKNLPHETGDDVFLNFKV